MAARLFTVIALSIALILGITKGAQAVPLKWTLNIGSATIDGNAANVSGSFIYDADLDQFSNTAITISGSAVGTANGIYDIFDIGNHDSIYLWHDGNNNNAVDYSLDKTNTDWGILLFFDGFLTNAGGTVNLHSSTIGPCAAHYADLDCAMYSFGGVNIATSSVTASAVSAVPLPAALPLILSGLGGLGFMGWRRRNALAA